MTMAKQKIGYESMGEFMADEIERISPEHGENLLQMVDDECSSLCSEPFRPELQAPCRLLVYSLATTMIEKIVALLVDSSYKKITGTPGLKIVE